MFIAMNRFKIKKGNEKYFEEIWENRDSHLSKVAGFINFNLIKGKEEEDYVVYASHSTWETEEHFKDWTKSESFREAHKNTGKHKDIYLGHPVFEGFKVIL
jgi:heme-degrading monooxygenase HmoA